MFEHGHAAGPDMTVGHSHDKLFKNVFGAFFKDLIELVEPEVAAVLDLDRVVFKTEPLYGHLGQSEHVVPDLVGLAPLRHGAGDRVVIVHLEIEARHRSSMERRMWRYFSLLNSRYDSEVFSVVVFLSGGPSGVEPRRHHLKIGKIEVNRFTYWAFGLSACDAEEWLHKPQLLAKALAAMMRTRGDRVEHKLRCLRAVAAEKNRGRYFLLRTVVDLYLKLRDDEQARYEAALAKENVMLPEIPDGMPLSIEELDEFLQQRADQLAEGQRKGLSDAILRQVHRRFAVVPIRLAERLREITEVAKLQDVLDAVFDATSLAQVEAAVARS